MSLLDELRGPKRQAILDIAAKHGVTSIRVFGSVARREDRPDSDVDFLIQRGPYRPPFFPGGLLMDLQDFLGKPVQVVTEPALHPLLKDRVLKEAISL